MFKTNIRYFWRLKYFRVTIREGLEHLIDNQELDVSCSATIDVP